MRSIYDCLGDPEEQPYIVPVLNDPTNLEARTRYAGWLAQRQDPRAEAVEIGTRLLSGVPDDAERARLSGRIVELMPLFDEILASLMFRAVHVKNCGTAIDETPRVRFTFQCPSSWGEMRPTSDEKIRFCDHCSSPVVHCESVAEAERQALLGACISVDNQLVALATRPFEGRAVGRPDVVAMWADHLFRGR